MLTEKYDEAVHDYDTLKDIEPSNRGVFVCVCVVFVCVCECVRFVSSRCYLILMLYNCHDERQKYQYIKWQHRLVPGQISFL